MKVLVTGAAGFIGSFVARKLLDRGDEVVGVDSLTPYYDVTLKQARLARLDGHPSYTHHAVDIVELDPLRTVFESCRPDRVVHLAAQAGVRYSLEEPHTYVQTNVAGFLNILEAIRSFGTEHLVYASTSSVYGANTKVPFSAQDTVGHPISLYAATKRSNELMAHAYSHLFGLPTTGLRFFTVYGPWGRPDMALFKFTKKILADEPIDIYNFGHHKRDFTYVDDIVEGVVRVLDTAPNSDATWSSTAPRLDASSAPFRVYNIGSNNPIDLLRYVDVLEECLGRQSVRRMLPMQPGDVADTYANVDSLVKDFDYRPTTSIEDGVGNFVRWYVDYYDVEPSRS